MSEDQKLHEYMSLKDKILFLSHFITKIILYVLVFLLLIIYLLLSIYFGNILHNIKDKENRPPLFNTYVIVSPSMVPSIKVQDGIVIQRQKVSNLKIGDIITFKTHDSRYDGLIITHRIVGIEKMNTGSYYFRTKGDANNVEDPYLVKNKDIYGRVIFKIPKVGYIKNYLSNSIFIFVFLIILFVIILVYDLHKMSIHTIEKKKDLQEDEDEELEII